MKVTKGLGKGLSALFNETSEDYSRFTYDESKIDDDFEEEEIEEYEPYDDTQVEEIVFEAVLDSESRF